MNVNEVPIVLLMEICITQLEVYYNHLTHPTVFCPWSFIAFLGYGSHWTPDAQWNSEKGNLSLSEYLHKVGAGAYPENGKSI